MSWDPLSFLLCESKLPQHTSTCLLLFPYVKLPSRSSSGFAEAWGNAYKRCRIFHSALERRLSTPWWPPQPPLKLGFLRSTSVVGGAGLMRTLLGSSSYSPIASLRVSWRKWSTSFFGHMRDLEEKAYDPLKSRVVQKGKRESQATCCIYQKPF